MKSKYSQLNSATYLALLEFDFKDDLFSDADMLLKIYALKFALICNYKKIGQSPVIVKTEVSNIGITISAVKTSVLTKIRFVHI